MEEELRQQNILYIPIIILQDTTSTTSVFTSPNVKTDPLRCVISIDQQSIVMDLSPKGLNVVEIHNVPVVTLKGEAKSYSTVMYYLRQLSFSSQKHPSLLKVQFQFSMNRVNQFCWVIRKAFCVGAGACAQNPPTAFHVL
jgi:hypothetical protein